MTKHIFPNTEMEDLYWYFINARQEAWFNRIILGFPRDKWTEDPILANARFTNVYRELDRGTQYAIAEVTERQACPGNKLPMVFHLLAYRWFNRIETYEAIRPHLTQMVVNPSDSADVEVALRERAIVGSKLYTGAYIMTAPKLGEEDGIGNAVKVLENMARATPAIVKLMDSEEGTLHNIFLELLKLPGIGDFLAYQSTLDFTYRLVYLMGRRSAENADQNSWAQPGPGAKKGLEILGVKGPTTTLIRAMKELAADQENGFYRIGVKFNYVRNRINNPVYLSVANMEHSLCEFQKYHRMLGGGHVKTVYSAPAGPQWRSKYESIPWWSGAQMGDQIWQR